MLERLSKVIKEANIGATKIRVAFSKSMSGISRPKLLRGRRNLEEDISDIATVLINMMLMGKEKASKCRYYDTETGLCMFHRPNVIVPTLEYVNKNGVLYINASKHPEICATCPYWTPKQ
ncbi:MAG: hypothetical protein QXT53_01760 [Ignisphaera sp.]